MWYGFLTLGAFAGSLGFAMGENYVNQQLASCSVDFRTLPVRGRIEEEERARWVDDVGEVVAGSRARFPKRVRTLALAFGAPQRVRVTQHHSQLQIRARRHHAFHAGPRAECLRLLHYCSSLCRCSHCPLRLRRSPGTLRLHQAPECPDVRPPELQCPNSRLTTFLHSVRGRPHYYSSKKEEYAHIKFDLDAGMHRPWPANKASSELTLLLDLTSLFNWNTKQVFAYITATYPSTDPSEPPSQAIIWDSILASPSAPWHQNHYVHPDPKASGKTKRSRSKGKQESPYPPGEFHLQKQRPKYQITDITGKLANRTDVQLDLGWNVQPWVGLLTWADWPPVTKYGGAWKELAGGKSKKFDFPPLKAKKEGDVATERGSEANKEGVYW